MENLSIPQEHPDLQAAVEVYLSERKKYSEKTYPGSAREIFEGERKMIEDCREKGYLLNWQPGEDILACITRNIEKSVTNAAGSVDMGNQIREAGFSPGILEEITKAREGLPGYFIVSMNEAKTVRTKDVEGNDIRMISLGQGECTNVVVVGKDTDGNMLASVFHFDPTNTVLLLDTILRERETYLDVTETKALIFTLPDENQHTSNALSIAIGRFPNVSQYQGHINKISSQDNLLLVTIHKDTRKVSIQMQGQDIEWQM